MISTLPHVQRAWMSGKYSFLPKYWPAFLQRLSKLHLKSVSSVCFVYVRDQVQEYLNNIFDISPKEKVYRCDIRWAGWGQVVGLPEVQHLSSIVRMALVFILFWWLYDLKFVCITLSSLRKILCTVPRGKPISLQGLRIAIRGLCV